MVHGQWSRLVNGCTTCNQRVTDYACIRNKINPIIFTSHIISPRHIIDSKLKSNRCNHIWLCSHSLDGDILQLQNDGCPSDIAQPYTSSVTTYLQTCNCTALLASSLWHSFGIYFVSNNKTHLQFHIIEAIYYDFHF